MARNPGVTLYSTGDSICELVRTPAGNLLQRSTYTQYFQYAKNIIAVNDGNAGDSLAMIYTRMQTSLASTSYPLIIIEGGFNDVNQYHTPLAEMEVTMTAMINFAKTKSDAVVVMNIPPNPLVSEQTKIEQVAFNDWLLSQENILGFQHFDMLDVLGMGGGSLDENPIYYGGETDAHPIALGHKTIADALTAQVTMPNTTLYIADNITTGGTCVKDEIDPVRSNTSPSGTLVSGTTQTTISLTTDEETICKYDTNSGTAYDSMTNTFTTTGETSHSKLVTGLSDGSTYNYYVRCKDRSTNQNTDDYTISFNISSNNSPTDIILSDSSTDENQAVNTVVGTLSTIDSDAGDTHTYSLACATPGVDDGSFNISSDSLRSSEVFDYETKSSYAICIRTSDGTDTYDENFTITINEPPSSGNSFFVSPPSTGNGLINYYLNIGETKNTGEIGFSGSNYLMYIGSQINFAMKNSPVDHSASIINLNMTNGDVTVEFKSEPIVVSFKIEEEKDVDLDNDGIADIRVRYNEL